VRDGGKEERGETETGHDKTDGHGTLDEC